MFIKPNNAQKIVSAMFLAIFSFSMTPSAVFAQENKPQGQGQQGQGQQGQGQQGQGQPTPGKPMQPPPPPPQGK